MPLEGTRESPLLALSRRPQGCGGADTSAGFAGSLCGAASGWPRPVSRQASVLWLACSLTPETRRASLVHKRGLCSQQGQVKPGP